MIIRRMFHRIVMKKMAAMLQNNSSDEINKNSKCIKKEVVTLDLDIVAYATLNCQISFTTNEN